MSAPFLRDGETLKDLGRTDRGFPCASRLAVLMTESGSDVFFMSRETIRRKLDANDDEIDKAFRMIVHHWKLFRYDAKTGKHHRRYLPADGGGKKKSERFKARVLRTIDAEYSIFCKVADITQRGVDGGLAPHSNADFAREIGRTVLTVGRCLASLEGRGYLVRIAGGDYGRARSLYFRPDVPLSVIDAIEQKRVERRERRAGRRVLDQRPEPVVINKDEVDRVVDAIVQARLARFNRMTGPADRASCSRYVVRLARELSSSPPPMARILEVARWYEQNCLSTKYMPLVEGGPSLYRKFSTVETMMLDHRGQRSGRSSLPTADEAIADLFNGSRILAEAFKEDVLGRAKHIDFGEVSEPELAHALAAVYREVEDARRGRPRGVDPSEVPGPLDVLRRYVDWLGEKMDWHNMTTRVLSTSSPAFHQWRRDEAALHPYGVDPLIGRG